MAPDPVILSGAGKRYRRADVLAGVDLAAGEAQCVAFVGHNGAGKTTLMKLVLGLTAPSAGSVRVWGYDPRAAAFSACRIALGYLPENVVFSGGCSGRDTLRFYARLKRVPDREVDEALERLGLSAAARRPVRTWSKGMRQRLGLAQALLGEPRLLVFDEPTSGLDPAFREIFYDCCRALRERGATVLISTHSLSEIEHRADRIAIMRAGRLLAVGTLDGLRARAGLPVTIRARVRPGTAGAVTDRLAGGLEVRRVNDHRIDIDCASEEKVALLRRLSCGEPRVEDLDVRNPGLDAVYRHFAATEDRR